MVKQWLRIIKLKLNVFSRKFILYISCITVASKTVHDSLVVEGNRVVYNEFLNVYEEKGQIFINFFSVDFFFLSCPQNM